jgi:hypothetical protein
MKKNTLNLLTFLLAIVAFTPAFAHDGHAMTGSHWHATDSWGFVALLTGLVVAIWLSRSGK